MRHICADGLNLIKEFESFSPVPYRCEAGILTVGYGHTGADVVLGMKISRYEAEKLLAHDLESSERAVLRLIKRPLTDGQFAALVSFVFNAGAGSLQASTLRIKCNRHEDNEVPAQFMRWNKVKDPKTGTYRVSKGLTRRRQAEARLYMI